jgi:hypothetical protein
LTEPTDLERALADLTKGLLALGSRFHVTGGLASSFYGEPRFTQDIDIVLRIAPGEALKDLVSNLSYRFIIDPEAAAAAVAQRRLFQALHEETMIRVDFHTGEAIPGELDRSAVVELFPGLLVAIVSREDAILSKLIWLSKGSHKSRQDIVMMLQEAATIDWEYMELQAGRLNVTPLLSELRQEARDQDFADNLLNK